MLNEIQSSNTGSDPLFYQIELTQEQYDSLSELLPEGFGLQIFGTPRKLSLRKKSMTKEAKALLLDNPSYDSGSIQTTSPDKRVLRDHSKKKTRDHMGRKYSDYESIPMTSSKVWKPTNEGMKKCYSLLQKLKKNPNAEPFLSRADGEEYGLTEYYEVVKDPLDLGTVEEKLRNEDYKSVNQFAADIRKIWNNAFRYVPKGSETYTMTVDISSYFEDLFNQIEDVSFNDTVKDLEKKVEKLSKQLVEINRNHSSGAKSNGSASKGNASAEKSSSGRGRSMSLEDKKILCQNIKKLPPEHLKGVWEIVGRGLKYSMDNRDVLEFDVHSLPMKITKELEKYVKIKMKELSKPNKGKGKGTSKKQQQQQQQQQQKNMNKKVQQFMPNINTPVKIVKPDLNNYNMYNDVPRENTIDEMDEYFNGSIAAGTRREGETGSRSGDSSFISDSDSESEIGYKHKNRIVDSFVRSSQEFLNNKPGDVTLYPF